MLLSATASHWLEVGGVGARHHGTAGAAFLQSVAADDVACLMMTWPGDRVACVLFAQQQRLDTSCPDGQGGIVDLQALLDSIPTPSAEEMAGRRAFAQRYTLVFLRKGPAPRDDAARNERLQLEHLQHLTKLQIAGKLVLNGPILAEHEILGVSVYAAELEEARALAAADPKVQAGYLTVEALPWMAVPREVDAD